MYGPSCKRHSTAIVLRAGVTRRRSTVNPTFVLYILAAISLLVLLVVLRKAQLRLQLSRAKHRSLAGHSRWSRRFAALVPFYEYADSEFFAADAAPAQVAAQRRAGFMRLAA